MRSTKRRINLEGNFYPSYFFNTLRHARRYLHVRNLHPETSPSKDQFFPLALATLPTRPLHLRSLFLTPCYHAPLLFPPRLVSQTTDGFVSSLHERISNFSNRRMCVCIRETIIRPFVGRKRGRELFWNKDIPRVCDGTRRCQTILCVGRVRFGLGFAYRMGVEIWEARTVESVQFFFWEGRESFVICKIQDVPDFFFLFLLFSCSFSLNFLNFFKFSRERQRGREKERESYFSSLVIFYFSPLFECVEQLFSVK